MIQRLLSTIFAVLGILGLASSGLAQTPTPEQLRALQALSPEQIRILQDLTPEEMRKLQELASVGRGALAESLAGQQADDQAPLADPDVIEPRQVDVDTLPNGESLSELSHFGYDLFAGEPSTFAPATDIPIPNDYVIGPGDTIEIQLYGAQNTVHRLAVTREGMLHFPDIGPLPVAGLQFSELRRELDQRIQDQMIGVNSSVTMGPLRSIRIFVLGDAYRPGSYTVSALSTMTNALFVSGGISTIGSLRNIQLKRNGSIVTTLDLYDLLLKGDTSGDARLQPGDVIFVPPGGPTVGVSGEVRRPAIYELKTESKASQVLDLAGGMLPTAFPSASQIERINSDRQRTIIGVDLSSKDGLATQISENDKIRVFSVLDKREDIVFLDGHVHRAGIYQWQTGARLRDIVRSTADLMPRADTSYVLIRRELPNNTGIDVLSADLGDALANSNSPHNVRLESRDRVIVFESGVDRSPYVNPILRELGLQADYRAPTRQVRITGRVRTPGAFPLETDMRVSDLLRAGGGLGEAAYELEAELTRYFVDADQTRKTNLIRVDLRRLLMGDESADIQLLPHDVLSIKEVPLWRELEQIEVRGEVRFPGSYPIRRGEKLSSVIDRAGGLTDLAFVDGAVFLREELRLREEEQIEELVSRLETDIKSTTASERRGEDVTAARRALLDQVRQTEAAGRLIIDLNSIVSGSASSDADIALADGDRLFIPRASQSVTVIGEVQFPTSYVYRSDLTRNDYIDQSGGFTADADKRRLYIVRADGSVESRHRSLFFRRGDAEIFPGDTVVVPLNADRMSKLGVWTSVTTVLYNIGVAAAAVASF